MSANPYESPKADIGAPHPAAHVAAIEGLARDFSAIQVSFFLNIMGHAALLAWALNRSTILGGAADATIDIFATGIFATTTLINAICAFWNGPRLYHPAVGLVMAFASVIPLVGLVAWLTFLRRIAALLENEGIGVGLFFVNANDLANRIKAITQRNHSETKS